MQTLSYTWHKLKESFFIFFLLAFIHASANLVFAQSVDEGKAIFQKLCVACHTIGEGKRVGPDLKGVTERRDISWLKGYIQSPSSYFKKNDPIATALLKEYKVPMPDPGLKEDEIEAVIAFLKGSDPDKMAMGTPSQYIPTIAVSVGAVTVLTLIALIAGTKKVEVR